MTIIQGSALESGPAPPRPGTNPEATAPLAGTAIMRVTQVRTKEEEEGMTPDPLLHDGDTARGTLDAMTGGG